VPRAILFDLDDTILSYGAWPLLLQEVVEDFAMETQPFTARQLSAHLEPALLRFWADITLSAPWRQRVAEGRRHVIREVFAGLAGRAPALTQEIADRVAARFNSAMEQQIKPFPSAEEVVAKLRACGIKLSIVTNGAAKLQRAKIERFALAQYFDQIQIEGEAGFGKPDARAYQHAMESLGVLPHETWMVGDNLVWEVEAPQQLGIFAVWHDHLGAGLPADGHVKPDLIVRDLSELLDALALR
jgi:putative hydrolase of the HAD superfamily